MGQPHLLARRGSRGFDFSPDGKELVYVSNHDPDPASSTNSDLWEVPADPAATIDEKTAVNLTAANHGWDGAPLFSPDGRTLAYLSQATPGYESDLFRLALYDVASKTVRYVTDKSQLQQLGRRLPLAARARRRSCSRGRSRGARRCSASCSTAASSPRR